MEKFKFIMNLRELYKPALNDGQIPFYTDFLSQFSEEALDSLWNITIGDHCKNSPPSLGELTKYSKGIKHSVTELYEFTKPDISEDEVFKTRLGRISLEQGWSNSYYLHCDEHGIPEQSDEMILKFQKDQQAAKTAHETLEPENNLRYADRYLEGIYQMMRKKSIEYFRKYKPDKDSSK